MPGSWFQAADGAGQLYVHTLTDSAPDPQSVIALLTARLFAIDAPTANLKIHLSGVRVFGSDQGWVARSATASKITLTTVDCEFLHMGDGAVGAVGSTGTANAISILGNVDIVLVRTRAAYAVLDGFNYHATSGYTPQFVEIDCVGHDNGNQPNSAGALETQNASTAHDGVKGVRIGGKGFRTFGAIYGDVNAGTQTLNLSCDVWDSLSPANSQGFSAQQTGAEMWVLGCRAWGNAADLYAVTGATIHAIDTEWDTRQGAGAFDLVNSI